MSTNTSTAAPGSHSNPTRHIKSIDNDMYCRAEEKEFEEECYLMPQALVEDHFDEAHDDLDADYDPKDDTLQGIKDAEEDEEDKKEEEPELIAKSGDTDNEECVVHADEFEKEFNEAIENVLRVAQMDREAILSNVRKEYERETGQEPTDQMIADAFKTFNICGTEETQNDADDEACDVDPQQFGKEFEKALQIVREVAKVDQELLVNAICNIYNDLCDEEPDAKQLSEIFGAVKEELADEAREEFVELYQVVEDDDSDSDYDEEEEEEESSSSSSEQTSHSESNEEEEATADDEIDINTTQFRTEFEEALAVVRDVAKLDQELLVNGICNIYNDLAEEEPDVTQLQEIFGAVKDELADEAKQQFVVKILDEDEKESDSDYVLQNEEEESESESEFEASEPDIFEDNLLEESDDGDYDPKQDESQGMMDEEEDLFDESSLSQEEGEEEEELQLNEEEMIETEAFEKEWNAAIDNVCFVAQRDRQTMLNNVRWQFEQETGEEATQEMMTDAIKTFEICDDEDDALCDIDSDEFRKEFEEALLVVRDVAKVDQARLVNTICDISSDLCDREPDVTQMSQIFDRIKESLADEAREEFLDLYETCVDHEDSDSDYDVRFDLNDCEESERGEFEWEKDNEDGMFNIGGFIDYSAAQSDVDCATEEEEEEEEIDLDSTEFRKEFEEALDVVRDVAKVDQELLVNSICNMCNDLADEEPDPQQLSEIFGAVKEGLAEEARESEVDDEDSDSDYDVDEDEMNDSETESEEFNWSESDASQSDIAEDESLTSDDDEDAIAQGFNIGGVDDDEALIDIEEVVEVEDALDYVDSDAFRNEFDEALQIVRDVAKVDQELLVNGICNIYNDLCDEEPDAKQLSLIFDAVKDGLAEEATQQLDDAEETEETDSDYDVAADDISSEEEEEETDEEEAEEEEQKLELESDEEIDIKSEEFRKEFEEALQVTRDVAKLDQELLVNGICNFYKDLCDQEPDLKQLTEIFGAVKEGLAEEATEQVEAEDEDSDSDYVDEDETNDSETESEEYNMWSESEASQSDIVEDESLEFEEEEEEEIDIKSPEFEKEFSEALESVRDAAKLDQELLVNGICNLYNDLRDEEPNAQQLSNIFGAVKAELADEATKQFVDSDEEDKENKDSDYDVAEDEANETDSEEYNWSESDESDEDYDPKEDQEQGTKDAEEDLFDESESDAKSEEDQ